MAKIRVKQGNNEIEIDSRDFYVDNDTAEEVIETLKQLMNNTPVHNVINTLKRDYPVVKGVLTIKCNEATAPYLEMKFARPDFKYRIPQWVKIEEE